MAGLVSNGIQHFTCVGLFLVLLLCGLGLPVPEKIALLTGGFLVHRRITQYPITLAVYFAGVAAGDNLLFFLGCRFGPAVSDYFEFVRPHTQPRIARLKNFMSRHGYRAIFYARFLYARFLAGVRALVRLTAGPVGVTSWRFFIYDALGAVISVPLAVSVGYFFGQQIDLAIGHIGRFDRMMLVVAAACIIFYASHLILGATESDRGAT